MDAGMDKRRQAPQEGAGQPQPANGLTTGKIPDLADVFIVSRTDIPPQTEMPPSGAVENLSIKDLVAEYNHSGSRRDYEQTLTALDCQVLDEPRILDAPLLHLPHEVTQKLATLTRDERRRIDDISQDEIASTIRRIQVLERLSNGLGDILSKAVAVDPAIVRSLMTEDSQYQGSDSKSSISGRILGAIIRLVPIEMVRSSLVNRYQGANLFKVENRARLAVNAQTKLDNQDS